MKLPPAIFLALCLTRPAACFAESSSPGAAGADHLATDGLNASLHGDFETASRLYRHAFALDPAPEYLYSAARTEHQGGHCMVAIADYATLLQLPSTPKDLRVKGEFHLAEARVAVAEHRCVAVLTRPASQFKASSAFALMGAGAVALVSATVLWLHARTDQSALDGYRDAATGQFRPDLIGPVAVRDTQASINERTVAAWALIGVGAAAGGVAAWLLLTDEPAVAQVSLGPQSIGIVGRF